MLYKFSYSLSSVHAPSNVCGLQLLTAISSVATWRAPSSLSLHPRCIRDQNPCHGQEAGLLALREEVAREPRSRLRRRCSHAAGGVGPVGARPALARALADGGHDQVEQPQVAARRGSSTVEANSVLRVPGGKPLEKIYIFLARGPLRRERKIHLRKEDY
jgi:hypothetical protein